PRRSLGQSAGRNEGGLPSCLRTDRREHPLESPATPSQLIYARHPRRLVCAPEVDRSTLLQTAVRWKGVSIMGPHEIERPVESRGEDQAAARFPGKRKRRFQLIKLEGTNRARWRARRRSRRGPGSQLHHSMRCGAMMEHWILHCAANSVAVLGLVT